MRRLLDGETVTHTGPHYRTEELALYPPPLNGTLPIMIGGGGERKTLRIVAQYADMWDAGTTPEVETIRRKLDALETHCAAVGRDPTSIERVISPKISIREDAATARDVYDAALRHNGAEPGPNFRPWAGPPEAIAEQMRPFIELGFRHFIVDLPSPYDRETIERWISEVKPLLG